LYQPDSITYTPEPRDDEEQNIIFRRRSPCQEEDDNAQVQQTCAADDRHTTRQFDDGAGSDGGYGVGYSVANHHIADFGDAPSTCYVGLETKKGGETSVFQETHFDIDKLVCLFVART